MDLCLRFPRFPIYIIVLCFLKLFRGNKEKGVRVWEKSVRALLLFFSPFFAAPSFFFYLLLSCPTDVLVL